MIFGSWTYGSKEVIIDYLDGLSQVQLTDYSFSGIWDIIRAPGNLNAGKNQISYHIQIRRFQFLS